MSLFTQIAGTALEAAYESIGTTDTSSTAAAEKTILQKLGLVKLISQDLGSAKAVDFLQAHDTVLGPYAQDVVNAVNGSSSSAVNVVLALIITQASS